MQSKLGQNGLMSWMLARVAPGAIMLLALHRTFACSPVTTRPPHSVSPPCPLCCNLISLGQSVAPPRPPPPPRGRRSTSARELLCLIRSMPLYGSRINAIFDQVEQGCSFPGYGTHNAGFRIAGVVGGAPPNRPRRVRLGTAGGSQRESLETRMRAPLSYP